MTLDRIATSLRTAEATSTPIAPIRDQITSAADAYAIQDLNTEARLTAGGRLVGRKIGLTNPDCTMAEAMRAVEYVVPAIEIVGSRIANWDIRFVDTVADNASSAFFTLGPSARKLTDANLLDCRMEMRSGDEVVSQGSGRACLGSPLNALVWLARVMAGVGRPLGEGDVVLSGALGPMVAAERGAGFVATIEGFGETAIRFGE